MTIDLGFAWLTLPSGESVGVVDVPGHIDFIENMLAGVGGVDAALLVIAADEGVMLQTREHLAILDLLEVSSGVVVLTKKRPGGRRMAGARDGRCFGDVGWHLPGRRAHHSRLGAHRGRDSQLARRVGSRPSGLPTAPGPWSPAFERGSCLYRGRLWHRRHGTLIDGMLELGQEVTLLPRG